MNPPLSQQRILIAAAWIGTAFAAYSIGSFRSTPDPSIASAPSSGKTSPSAAFGAAPSAGGDALGGRPFEAGHNASGRTLSEIVNGQSLEDYLKRVLSLDDEIKRTSAFLELLETLNTPEDLQLALAAVAQSGRGSGRGMSSREYSMLLQKWTTLDPRGAAEYATKVESRDGRYLSMSKVLRTWTGMDATTALAWAQSNGIEPTDDPALRERRIAEGNYAVSMVVAQLSHTDIHRAVEVAGADGNTRASTRLADDLAGELFKQLGEEAARDAILAMPGSKLRDSMIGEHADRLAKTDSPGAARWAATLPSGGGRSRALAEAIAEWADDDAAAAGNFLNGLPPSSDSDAARERFARNVFDQDPVGALSWAASITDAGDRQQTSERLVRSWIRKDAGSAKNWVQQSTLPDEVKQRYLAPGAADVRGRN